MAPPSNKEIDMSKMADLWIEIEEAYNDGVSPRSIARNLDIPLDWVMGVLEEVEEDEQNC
jgi:hypothetical protein